MQAKQVQSAFNTKCSVLIVEYSMQKEYMYDKPNNLFILFVWNFIRGPRTVKEAGGNCTSGGGVL